MIVRLTVIFSWRLTDGRWCELAAVGVAQHHAPVVGRDRVENEFQDAIEELIEIENVADRLSRFIHDAQAGEPRLEPLRADLVRSGEDAAPLVLGHRLDDGRRDLVLLRGDQANLVGDLGRCRWSFGAGGAEDQDRLSEGDVVARPEGGFLDRLGVDECAVGAADVAEPKDAVVGHDFGVLARDFGVVQDDAIGPVATNGQGLPSGQLELLALIGTLDDDQARHVTPLWATVPM
jgi:hypothetical protein